ncbi:hypothetical protein GRF29_154g1511575 [Pseudopithomyces chartarum]|uniref:Uncharacterized protein n=1 Tax=Pseudopithomyces chartarum TaxID=1892770 RepID=A0AAN6LSJ1_9PLEO|nr:hypothetical protein GRF29_154g1511575 [Pseudopithomyces chartarum]
MPTANTLPSEYPVDTALPVFVKSSLPSAAPSALASPPLPPLSSLFSSFFPVSFGASLPDFDADAKDEAADEAAALGHGFSYTYCSVFPSHFFPFVASNVPLEYIQHVPDE